MKAEKEHDRPLCRDCESITFIFLCCYFPVLPLCIKSFVSVSVGEPHLGNLDILVIFGQNFHIKWPVTKLHAKYEEPEVVLPWKLVH